MLLLIFLKWGKTGHAFKDLVAERDLLLSFVWFLKSCSESNSVTCSANAMKRTAGGSKHFAR